MGELQQDWLGSWWEAPPTGSTQLGASQKDFCPPSAAFQCLPASAFVHVVSFGVPRYREWVRRDFPPSSSAPAARSLAGVGGGGQGLRGSQVNLGSGAPQSRSQEIWKTGQGFWGCRVRQGSLRSRVGARHPAAYGLPPPVGRTAESLGTVDGAPRPACARVKTPRPAASVPSHHYCPELSLLAYLSCFHCCRVLPCLPVSSSASNSTRVAGCCPTSATLSLMN